ncbi:MAG: phosphatase PAP2 family protein, partial [Rhizobiaceae bacterium]
MKFNRAEMCVLWLTGCAALACAALAYGRGVTIEFTTFAWSASFNLVMIMIGQFYRTFRPDERIATVITAISFLMVSGQVFGTLTYLNLPYRLHGGDQFLAQADAALGFHWASFVTAAAQYPLLCGILKQVYLSCAWQIAATILALGYVLRFAEIGKFVLALLVGAAITTGIWVLYPSSTPAAFQALPADVAARLGLVVSPQQGAWLVKVSHEGLSSIGSNTEVGTIGFPSYHTVLAFTTLYYSRSIRLVHMPVMLLVFLMVPAILIHGSHNLI